MGESSALLARRDAEAYCPYSEQEQRRQQRRGPAKTWSYSCAGPHGWGVAGTSIAHADFPFSASRDLSVSGWTVDSWTWRPEPGEPPRGEIEYRGELVLECLAAVPSGKGYARSNGWVELEIIVDTETIYNESVELDLARVTSDHSLGDIYGSLGPPGLRFGASIPINTVRGNGESSGENREPVPSNAVCGVSFVRISRSKVRHALSIEWIFHLWKSSIVQADTLGYIHWDFWEPLVGCPGD